MSIKYNSNSGLSPTVGIILVVAITVAISVVIGVVALDVGDGTTESVQAGVDIQQQGDGYYQIQWQTAGNAKELQVLVNGTELDDATLSDPGDSVTVGVSEGDTISVSGSNGDSTAHVSSTTASDGDFSSPTVSSTPETKLVSSTSDTSGSGETVTVDYSVTNESDSEKDMTVTLDVSDGVGEVDSTTESTVSSGETRTGSLTWDVPSDQETGEYTLTTSGGGETDTTTVSIQTPINPEISVSDSNTDDTTITVSVSTDISSSSIQSIEWDMGDGTTLSGPQVTHTYSDYGEYDVSVTVTDDAGYTESSTRAVSISQPIPTDGMVAHWSFDNKTSSQAVESVNGYDGTFHGGSYTTNGYSESAVDFSGNSEYIHVGDYSDLRHQDSMSFSVWVNPDSHSKSKILHKQNSGNSGLGYILRIENNGDITFMSGDNGDWHRVRSSSPIPRNEWTHIAVTKDGGNLKFYVDGAEVDSLSASYGEYTSGAPFQIGGRNCCSRSGQFIDGQIDELRVYDRTITATEVQQLNG